MCRLTLQVQEQKKKKEGSREQKLLAFCEQRLVDRVNVAIHILVTLVLFAEHSACVSESLRICIRYLVHRMNCRTDGISPPAKRPDT